jgi:ribosome biogenesis GTPase
LNKGIVYRSTGSWYLVKDSQGIFYSCRIKGKFRIQGIKSTNPIAVGDQVEFDLVEEGSEMLGIITEIDLEKIT